jgi:hypothetical protein
MPEHQDTRVVADWVAQTAAWFRQKYAKLHRISAVLPVSRAFDAAKPGLPPNFPGSKMPLYWVPPDRRTNRVLGWFQ